MSRNFELLQRLGEEEALLRPTPVVEPPKAPEPAPEVVLSEPQLEMDATELEQLTKLTQRVFVLPGTESVRVVVFTATESGNGCSWICARAAELLASQVRGSVCLVDANLRNPSLHHQFGVDNHYGLADALRGTDPVTGFTRTLSRPNLSLLSSGSSPELSLPLLSSDRMRQRLAELRNQADYVLIDAPGLNVSTEAATLGAAADGMVLVLKAHSSRKETVRKSVQELQAAKVAVLGAVLNQRTFPIPESVYKRL
jgi:capsular exopolysaccharide synthesis family protein